ncbi:MAG: hypothetical protein GXY89_02875 [Tissierellia bacterium]|nr:hypothetical protein [Tissierellia bacterium]
MSDFIFSGTTNWVMDSRYKKYSDKIISIFNEEPGHADVFVLCLVLGYKYNSKSEDFVNNGAEFRPSYFTKEQRNIISAIAYDIYGDRFIKELNDKEFKLDFRNLCRKYYNGGMEILIEKVFKDNMKDEQFLNTYNDYDVDLLRFIIDELEGVPF